MNSPIYRSHADNVALCAEYSSLIHQVGQAEWDRWPEARAMYRRLVTMGANIGISKGEVDADLKYAHVIADGGRW